MNPTDAVIDADSITPLDHQRAMRLQETELSRTIEMLEALSAEQWATQTECPDWDVHRMYLHVLGACEAGASTRENLHQMRKAFAHRRRHGGPLEAALSHVQVAERTQLTPAQLVDRLTDTAPATVRGRTRTPSVMRQLTMKVDGPVFERWKLGYLIDVIYLRDLWLHRVDAAVATGRPLTLTADHDGVIVADVVGEWARRHGSPFVLTLTGAAGGAFAVGESGPGLQLDAVEFCRTVGGRLPGEGLLETVVPF